MNLYNGDKALGIMRLQGIGIVKGILASEMKIGMHIYYNYGYSYEILDIQECSPKFLMITQKSTEKGEIYKTRFKKDRLVAAHFPKN